ncbi:hypothetical protein F5890DRAFT_1383914, partial [Lentinula detonsa]
SLLTAWSKDELNRWANAYQDDPHFVNVIQTRKLETDMNRPIHPQYFVADDNLIYFEDALGNLRLCVPRTLRAEIMNEVHNTITEAAHAG